MRNMQEQCYEEDTIDLRELWAVLRKRKRLIWLTTGVVTLAALAYVLLVRPVYEAKATVEIGKELKKNNSGLLVSQYIDNVEDLKQYLDIKYDIAGKYRDKNSTCYIKSVDVPKKNKTGAFLTITAYAGSNGGATKTIQKPLDDILSKDKVYYDMILERKEDKLEKLHQDIEYETHTVLPQLKQDFAFLKTSELKKIDNKIKLIKIVNINALNDKIKQSKAEISKKIAAIKSMRKEIVRVAKQDPTLATMTSMQMANLENDIARLKAKIIDLESKISTINEETIPNLEAQRRKLLEIIIPAKEAEIEKMTSITLPRIHTQIKEVEMSMKAPYLVMTHIIHKIYTHDKPVKPKKKLIVIVAFITGLMLSIFLAFFLEFIGKDNTSSNT
ncbi:Wzz/FepE/Etk N-terminal domain-containing protein [Sulfurimonas sp.]|uniref:Wzz/FepE/Etk N-terminal domain-containing protein n=1 Tax=Sulfurimonas sp. TaxID=2022749 RepID=UPI00261F6270|nr:Wzz/FepE/Etk N-terminal domain-containing protein [Sulfurimonas sp.]